MLPEWYRLSLVPRLTSQTIQKVGRRAWYMLTCDDVSWTRRHVDIHVAVTKRNTDTVDNVHTSANTLESAAVASFPSKYLLHVVTALPLDQNMYMYVDLNSSPSLKCYMEVTCSYMSKLLMVLSFSYTLWCSMRVIF